VSNPPIRVLVVDDSVVVRQLVSDALRSDPSIEVVGQAPNGKVALEKLAAANPDIVTLDIEMPEMDGLTTLAELRKVKPRLPVIMFSTLTERGATSTLEALARGASDYVCKPSGQRNVQATLDRIKSELIPKIHALCARSRPAVARQGTQPQPRMTISGTALLPGAAPPIGEVKLIVIAVSTGGPGALAGVIPLLPRNMLQPVLIVQHMPAVFTRVFAQRLHEMSQLKVSEAIHQDRLEPGRVFIAPGDHHMRVAGSPREAWITLDQGPQENGCRPAADPLFHSAAQIFGSSVLGVVLTGLGQDGTKGAGQIKRAGGQIWVQDEASATVWGMPGSIVQAGLASRVIPLVNMARALAELSAGVTHAGPRSGAGSLPTQLRSATAGPPTQPRSTTAQSLPTQPRPAAAGPPTQPRSTTAQMPAQPRPATAEPATQPRGGTGSLPTVDPTGRRRTP
jgi:two-component system, chemotaxis family, protein-glutamate methylesterase/glutaminase